MSEQVKSTLERAQRPLRRIAPDPDPGDLDAYSIREFCRRHSISEGLFFKLQARGEAPPTIAIGTRRLVTKEAARAWRKQRAQISAAG